MIPRRGKITPLKDESPYSLSNMEWLALKPYIHKNKNVLSKLYLHVFAIHSHMIIIVCVCVLIKKLKHYQFEGGHTWERFIGR